jgi:hypothetical protein
LTEGANLFAARKQKIVNVAKCQTNDTNGLQTFLMNIIRTIIAYFIKNNHIHYLFA